MSNWVACRATKWEKAKSRCQNGTNSRKGSLLRRMPSGAPTGAVRSRSHASDHTLANPPPPPPPPPSGARKRHAWHSAPRLECIAGKRQMNRIALWLFI